MPFADHFRKASINKNILTAECKKADGKTWVQATINLDEHLGNINGKFEVAPKGTLFSKSATDITLNNGILAAKLRNKADFYVDAKFDLGTLLQSADGVIARIPATPVLPMTPVSPAPPTVAAGSIDQTTAAAGYFASAASASSASATTTQSSTSTVSTSQTSISRSSSTFSSSKFRYHSQQLLIEETCTNFFLKGTWLHCDIHHEDGRITRASIDLDLYICGDDGRLLWDGKGFSKTCTEIKLDGWFLVAKCHNPLNQAQFLIARLDLRTRIRVQGAVLIVIETNKKLSMMLSEVPWMKFKVIAEPDLSVFSSHPVVKQTMTRIAESTVEHVTNSMHAMITKAMEAAIVEITASAMKHVSMMMEQSVQGAVGYASASMSATEAELLHIGGGVYGGYGHHDHAHGRHEHYGGVVAHGNGQLNGGHGVWAGWSHSSAHGSISRTSSQSSSVSASSAHSSATGYTATGALNGAVNGTPVPVHP